MVTSTQRRFGIHWGRSLFDGVRDDVALACYSAALAVVVGLPLLRPGYLLLRDAVSTPREYLTDTALGVGGGAPRSVPQDAVVAVLSTVIDGGSVVKAVTLLAVCGAGWGAGTLAGEVVSVGLGPKLVAATVAIWNPYVAERLLQGQWSLLVGYAAVGWIALFARRPRLSAELVAATAVAAFTPTGGLFAGIIAIVVSRQRLLLTVLTVLTWLPWLVVAVVVASAGRLSDPAGVPAFAARAEPGLGTLGSLAGLGGIWNAAAVPPSRHTWFAVPATAVLLVLVGMGMPTLWRRSGGRIVVFMAAAAIGGAAVAATTPGMAVMQWLVLHVPGAGLLRDTQKFVALALPAYACAAAVATERLARRVKAVRCTTAEMSTAIVVAGALVAVLPDLALGVMGRVHSVHYPPSWQCAAAALDTAKTEGAVAVVPAGTFRRFGFSGDVPVLDPAPRMLPRDVLGTGTLIVRAGTVLTVAGEGDRARAAETALIDGDSPDRLAALGVGAVLVERDTPGPRGAARFTLARLHPLYADSHLELYRVPGRIAALPSRHRGLTIVAYLVWLGVFSVACAASLARRLRR